MIELDPFIVNHNIESMREKSKQMREDFNTYVTQTNDTIIALNKTIEELSSEDNSLTGSINTLMDMINGLSEVVSSLNKEIVETKLNNIKQEMITRTLLNLQQYQAHDMFVDTFTTADGIDQSVSTRADWFSDLKAVGRTTASTVYANQESRNTSILITGNAGEDNALCQSFVLDKIQDIDKISLYIEKHDPSVWKPLVVKITDDILGTNIITSGSINPADINDAGFYDIELNNIQLTQYTDYYITIFTDDTYGYRIGVDNSKDTYFAGSSYIQFNGVWTDNNFDIAFKVWCYAAADEGNATIITTPYEFEGKADSIVFDVEAVTYSGSVNYFVSIDDGANWKILEPGIKTMLTDLPTGNKLRLKAYIEGNSRIDAWGYVIKRGDK